jgi:hypothetical protein
MVTWRNGFFENFMKLDRLSIVAICGDDKSFKKRYKTRGKKYKYTYHQLTHLYTNNYIFDYTFDTNDIDDCSCKLSGKPITVNIPSGYFVDHISFYYQGEEVIRVEEDKSFEFGGTYTFNGLLTISLEKESEEC